MFNGIVYNQGLIKSLRKSPRYVKGSLVIEVSSNFEDHTTSYDGFVLASSGEAKRVFQDFKPLGRLDILNASPQELIDSLKEIN